MVSQSEDDFTKMDSEKFLTTMTIKMKDHLAGELKKDFKVFDKAQDEYN